jgi:hypothetical protein
MQKTKIIFNQKPIVMKTLSKQFLFVLLIGALGFTACENTFNDGPEVQESILPDELTVEIPASLSADLAMHKSAVAVDTLKGREIYGHLRFFIHSGHAAARITRDVIHVLKTYNIDQVKTLTYESEDDGRIKNLVVVEAPEFEGRTWEYGLTITDAESEGNPDGGKALQIFWSASGGSRVGITLINPYNLDRSHDGRWAKAMYRIDYSGRGERGYDRYMIVSIADLPDVEPLLAPFAMNAMKMFVGAKGDFVDVFGNTSHPNAKFLSEKVGYNWAFVASASKSRDIAAVELGLPLNTVDSNDRVVLLERNSIYNVLYNEVMTVWPHSSEEIINAWLTNTEAPGYFNEGGFIQGGTAPSDEYLPLVERIALLTPYNPSMIAALEINFQ